MEEFKPRKVYEAQTVNDYRELLKMVKEKYSKNIAYKYKKDYTAKEPEYIEVTYEKYVEDVKALSTGLLSMEKEGKKVVLIGKNSYEWCTAYMAVTTGNMVVVPLDKALPDAEIETLVNRSEADVVFFDKKYIEVMKKLKDDVNNNLSTLICMDDDNLECAEGYNKLLEKGYDLLKNNDKRYENLKIDNKKMSIMLFTSGTTNLPKAVMLSQYNICSDISAIATWVKIYDTDTLLSFLPIHHTFECTITFLYGMYSGATVAFSDGLKYIREEFTRV